MNYIRTIDERISEPSALWGENEGKDVGTGGYYWVGNLLNDARSKGVASIFGPGFSEEFPSTTSVDVRPTDNDASHSHLIR